VDPRGRLAGVLINRDFARLWAGQAVSQVGDYVFTTTLTLWIAAVLLRGRPYAPVAVSGLLVAVAVATMVAAPVAGVFVDRWDRRRTMLAADATRVVLVGGLTVVAFLPAGTLPAGVTLGLTYATVLTSTVAAQFFNPARFAYLGQVVTGSADRTRAAGISQATASVAAIAGPPLAAPLLFTAGVSWALLLDALSFAVSFAAVWSVRVPDAPEPVRPAGDAPAGFRAELLAGLRFTVRSRVMLAIFIGAVVVTLGSGALNTLDVFFVTTNLHAPASWFGTVGMAEGVGAVIGALLAGWLGARLGNVRVIWLGLLVSGAVVLGYARQGALWPALVLIVLIGLPIGAVNAVFGPVMLAEVPSRFLGRVISFFTPVQQVANLTAAVLCGWLVSAALRGFHPTVAGVHLGPIDTVFTAAGLLVIAGGGYIAVALRRYRPAPVAEEEPSPVA
jgi:MFS family permease